MPALHACPICSSARIKLRFNGFTNRNPADGRVWPVFECGNCGHGFLNPQPDRETLGNYYGKNYEAYEERHAADGDNSSILERARASGEFRHIPVPTGKRVLDFGCGGGFFLGICKQLGADVQGIEPSPHGARTAQEQGIPVFRGTLDDFLEQHGDRRFDVITANHVIEHVPDPVTTLSGLGTLLADGGKMTIAVPNARSTFADKLGAEWHSTDLPIHLHQFSAASLRKAADRAGLSTAKIETTSMTTSIRASLQLLLRRKYLIPQLLTRQLPISSYAERLAKRHDAEENGEALLAIFEAKPPPDSAALRNEVLIEVSTPQLT